MASGRRVQRAEVAGVQRLQQHGLRDVGVDDGQPERQPFLPGDLLNDLPGPGHVRVRARATAGADDDRDPPQPAGDEHVPQVAVDGLPVGEGDAGAEVAAGEGA